MKSHPLQSKTRHDSDHDNLFDSKNSNSMAQVEQICTREEEKDISPTNHHSNLRYITFNSSFRENPA